VRSPDAFATRFDAIFQADHCCRRLSWLHAHALQVRQTKSQSASKKNSGMTEEELLAQQELLFAASKARFEAGGGGVPPAEGAA